MLNSINNFIFLLTREWLAIKNIQKLIIDRVYILKYQNFGILQQWFAELQRDEVYEGHF